VDVDGVRCVARAEIRRKHLRTLCYKSMDHRFGPAPTITDTQQRDKAGACSTPTVCSKEQGKRMQRAAAQRSQLQGQRLKKLCLCTPAARAHAAPGTHTVLLHTPAARQACTGLAHAGSCVCIRMRLHVAGQHDEVDVQLLQRRVDLRLLHASAFPGLHNRPASQGTAGEVTPACTGNHDGEASHMLRAGDHHCFIWWQAKQAGPYDCICSSLRHLWQASAQV